MTSSIDRMEAPESRPGRAKRQARLRGFTVTQARSLGLLAARCEHCGSILGRTERPLTRNQARIYQFIETQQRRTGWAPSFKEIAKRFRYRSLATVHEHLTHLEAKGWIRRAPNEARAIECLVRSDDR